MEVVVVVVVCGEGEGAMCVLDLDNCHRTLLGEGPGYDTGSVMELLRLFHILDSCG